MPNMQLCLTEVTKDSATSLGGKTDQLDDLYCPILNEAYKLVGVNAEDILTQVLCAMISTYDPLSIHSLAMLMCFSCNQLLAVFSICSFCHFYAKILK